MRMDQGKEPDMDSAILGVPLEYLDLIVNIIRISQDKKVKVAQPVEEGFIQQDEYKFKVGFDFVFKIQTYIYVYFSAVDVISQLGGLGATFKLILGAIAPLMILKFMQAFGMIILRKAQQKVRIFRLKDITKHIKTINKRITEKIKEN